MKQYKGIEKKTKPTIKQAFYKKGFQLNEMFPRE